MLLRLLESKELSGKLLSTNGITIPSVVAVLQKSIQVLTLVGVNVYNSVTVSVAANNV